MIRQLRRWFHRWRERRAPKYRVWILPPPNSWHEWHKTENLREWEATLLVRETRRSGARAYYERM